MARELACSGYDVAARKETTLRREKTAGTSESAVSHLEDMLDEALRETFPASDPIAITIAQPPKVVRASKVVVAPSVMRASMVRGPLIADPEPEAKIGAEKQSLPGPFNAMFWGPIQLFNWWSLLMGSGLTHSPDKASAAK
jgi:hypothetical protein